MVVDAVERRNKCGVLRGVGLKALKGEQNDGVCHQGGEALSATFATAVPTMVTIALPLSM
jgi:hypothetical protein